MLELRAVYLHQKVRSPIGTRFPDVSVYDTSKLDITNHFLDLVNDLYLFDLVLEIGLSVFFLLLTIQTVLTSLIGVSLGGTRLTAVPVFLR